MYEVNLIGSKGKVKCPEIKLLKELDKDCQIDLKILKLCFSKNENKKK